MTIPFRLLLSCGDPTDWPLLSSSCPACLVALDRPHDSRRARINKRSSRSSSFFWSGLAEEMMMIMMEKRKYLVSEKMEKKRSYSIPCVRSNGPPPDSGVGETITRILHPAIILTPLLIFLLLPHVWSCSFFFFTASN